MSGTRFWFEFQDIILPEEYDERIKLNIHKRYWPFYAIIALTIILILAFLFDWWPALRGGYGWRWPYVYPELSRFERVIPALLAIIFYLLGVRILGNSRTFFYLTWCLLGAFIIPVALLNWWGDPLDLLFSRTVSGLVTGGFSVAAKSENLGQTIQQWPMLMETLKPESIHIALSLPGWPIVYYGVTKVLQTMPFLSEPLGMMLRPYLCNNVPIMGLSNSQIASAWLGILSPLWAALTVIPLYYLGRAAAEESVARKAVTWWPLVPSTAAFLATLNSPTPLLAATIIYFLWTGLVQERGGIKWRLIIAGVLTAAALILTFAFIPLLLFAGVLALVTWRRDPTESWLHEFRKPVIAGLQFGLGLLIIFAGYSLAAGHTPYDILAKSMEIHLELERRYWPWLWLHSWDFIVFVALPAFALFLMGLTRWARMRIRQLAIALVITLAIVILSGTARGETGRLWIFFMPLVLLVAVDILVQLPRGLRYALVACQAIWLVILFMILPTTGRGITAPPTYSDVAFTSRTAAVIPTLADFDGQLQLEGYSAEYDSDENRFIIDFHWRPQDQMAIPYFFSVLLVAPDGTVLPAFDWQPFDYQYPTTCWHDASAVLIDRINLPVEEESVAGDYWLSLSVFHIKPDGELIRLPVTLSDGSHDIQVGLGPLEK